MSQHIHIGLFKIITSIGGWKIKLIKLLDYIFGSAIAFCIIPRKKIPFPKTIQKILIIRPGGIGDAIFLLPILKSIKSQYPNLTIDILCESRNFQGFISQKDSYNRLFRYDHWNEFKIIFRQSYDIIIDTEQWHYFSSLVAYFSHTHYRIGFNTRRFRSKLFEESHAYNHNAYELENFKGLFKHLIPQNNSNYDSIENSFCISEHAKQWAQTKIPENTISLFLGASIALRRLTSQQSLDIIHSNLTQNWHVVLLGGKDIESDAKTLEQMINQKGVYNFVGKTTLEESAALIQRSRLFIGTDSGLMHLACAVGTPVIGIFGPGNLKKWGPKGERNKIISLNLPCSPCTFFGYTKPSCGGKYQCMKELDFTEIKKFIK